MGDDRGCDDFDEIADWGAHHLEFLRDHSEFGTPLHLVSAWASTQRLVLAQEAVDAKENECAAILTVLGRLSLKRALVSIDAHRHHPHDRRGDQRGGR